MSEPAHSLTELFSTLAAQSPYLIVLAGPNGAGKSSFYRAFVNQQVSVPFVNADLIEKELLRDQRFPPDAYQAAQAAELLRRELLRRGESFCMETVFSDPVGDKVRFLQDAQAAGYFVVLIYIGLESEGLSEMRVAHRVQHGGHDVPAEKLKQRFPRSLKNLSQAVTFVDSAYLLDNSKLTAPFRFVAEFRRGTLIQKAQPVAAWAQQCVSREASKPEFQ